MYIIDMVYLNIIIVDESYNSADRYIFKYLVRILHMYSLYVYIFIVLVTCM